MIDKKQFITFLQILSFVIFIILIYYFGVPIIIFSTCLFILSGLYFSDGQFSVFWIFFFIIAFCLYVLAGLYITEGILDLKTLIFTWVIYTCLWLTFANVFLLGYFWSTIRKKTGPTGIRGLEGEDGHQGIDGSCSITETQKVLMIQLNNYIDELYKNKSGQSILNQESQRFPNIYLNNKISTQAGSRQYNVIVATLSNQNKPVSDIVNYLKSIWKIWFDLIYTANAEWFLDEYADEDYSWADANPFDEIKKYDIYYWGITRSFRPLKAEICRSSPNYESAKLPLKPQARLKIIQSNDYYIFANDDGTHGDSMESAGFWRARSQTIGSDTYYPVSDMIFTQGSEVGRGDYTVDEYQNPTKKGPTIIGDLQYNAPQNGADIRTLLVSGDVKDPIGYQDLGFFGGRFALNMATPICPEGYVAMGDIMGTRSNYNSNNNPVKCVPTDCVDVSSTSGIPVWGIGGGKPVVAQAQTLNGQRTGNYDANGDNGYNVMRLVNMVNFPNYYIRPFYRIKEQCLAPPSAPSTKEPESEFSDLGVGWHGHPYKTDPRYSIFTFLNLVPEGMIVHKATGRRFYIIHYGGEEANIYNVLEYSATTDKFDNGLQVDSNANGAKVVSRPLSRKDERQQWRIVLQTDKRFMKLKNFMNNKYLFMGLEPVKGDAQFSTIDFDFDNYKSNPAYSVLSYSQIQDNTTFSFISTFGTQMDIIDKVKPKSEYVQGNRIRISTQKKQPITISGVFIYDNTGKVINTDRTKATSSSAYQNHGGSNAIKIVSENSSRNINQAINGVNLLSKYPGWNSYETNGSYFCHTNGDGKATTGGDWWEYKFPGVVNIAAIEIYGRYGLNPERWKNMTLQIFNDGKYGNDPVWDGNTGTDANDAQIQVFVIEKNGTIHHQGE